MHSDEEQSECRRLRVIPPLNEECDVPNPPPGCLEFHCVIAKVGIPVSTADWDPENTGLFAIAGIWCTVWHAVIVIVHTCSAACLPGFTHSYDAALRLSSLLRIAMLYSSWI